MNERIKELHGQAYLYALHNETKAREGGSHEPGTFDNDYREKFAELIVRECVTKLKETKKVELPFIQAVNEHAQELPLSVYIAELKQHFGVEDV
jgi:hypothetical protein